MRAEKSAQRGETLEYLQAMLGQMRSMAEAERCDMLAYLIEMAYVEVSELVCDDKLLQAPERKAR